MIHPRRHHILAFRCRSHHLLRQRCGGYHVQGIRSDNWLRMKLSLRLMLRLILTLALIVELDLKSTWRGMRPHDYSRWVCYRPGYLSLSIDPRVPLNLHKRLIPILPPLFLFHNDPPDQLALQSMQITANPFLASLPSSINLHILVLCLQWPIPQLLQLINLAIEVILGIKQILIERVMHLVR